MLIHFLPPEMLHTKPNGVNDANLIDLQNTEVWLLKSSRVRAIGKAFSLSNASYRKDIVQPAIESFQCRLKCCALRVPICYIDFSSPNALASVFVQG